MGEAGAEFPPIEAPPPGLDGGSCAPELARLADAVDTGLLTLHDALAEGLYSVHVQTKELIKTHAPVKASTSSSQLQDDEEAAEDCQPIPDLHLRVQARISRAAGRDHRVLCAAVRAALEAEWDSADILA